MVLQSASPEQLPIYLLLRDYTLPPISSMQKTPQWLQKMNLKKATSKRTSPAQEWGWETFKKSLLGRGGGWKITSSPQNTFRFPIYETKYPRKSSNCWFLNKHSHKELKHSFLSKCYSLQETVDVKSITKHSGLRQALLQSESNTCSTETVVKVLF